MYSIIFCEQYAGTYCTCYNVVCVGCFKIGAFWLFLSLGQDLKSHLSTISFAKKDRQQIYIDFVEFIQFHSDSKR